MSDRSISDRAKIDENLGGLLPIYEGDLELIDMERQQRAEINKRLAELVQLMDDYRREDVTTVVHNGGNQPSGVVHRDSLRDPNVSENEDVSEVIREELGSSLNAPTNGTSRDA